MKNYRYTGDDSRQPRRITETQYDALSYYDQLDYRRIENDDSLLDDVIDIGAGLLLGSLLNGDNDSDSSNSNDTTSGDSFDGFGGGSFGGAGTEGLW